MLEKAHPGAWHVSWSNDEPPMVLDQSDNTIAVIDQERPDLMLARASLIAATPELYDSVAAAVTVFTAIAKYGDKYSALAAQDIIPPLKSALDGASFLGPITPEVLSAG